MGKPSVVRFDIPADLARLPEIGDTIAELLEGVPDVAEPEVTRYNVQLAVHEIAVNIVEHAYAGRRGGRIRGSVSRLERPRRLVVELFDRGRHFTPEEVPGPDLSEPHEGGYGLFLVYALLDEVSYSNERGENRWLLVKLI